MVYCTEASTDLSREVYAKLSSILCNPKIGHAETLVLLLE
jgi:hypothetical protein